MSALATKPTNQPVWLNENTAKRGVQIGSKTLPIGKQLPNSEPDERLVLGSILAAGIMGKGNELFRRVSSHLNHTDFFSVKHGYIWRAMEKVVEQGDQVDVKTVAAQLRNHTTPNNRTLLQEIGGDTVLMELANHSGPNLESYARTLQRFSVGREMLVASLKLSELSGRVGNLTVDECTTALTQSIRESQTKLVALSDRQTYDVSANLDSYIASTEERFRADYKPGLSTGFSGLDKCLLGLRKAKLYLFSAPSGWGKTALMLNLAVNVLRKGGRVLYISLEMGSEEMMDRLTCLLGMVDSSTFQRGGSMSERDVKAIRHGMSELRRISEGGRFIIETMSQPTIEQVEAKLIQHQLSPGYDVVFIDYVMTNTLSDGGRFRDNERLHMQHVYATLERWKKDYNVPVFAATQMNKGYSTRKARRPEVDDLYFGSIGKMAADVVAFLYQERYAKDEPDNLNAEIIIRKNRSGPMNRDVTVELEWQPEYQLFSDAMSKLPVPGAGGYTFGGAE